MPVAVSEPLSLDAEFKTLEDASREITKQREVIRKMKLQHGVVVKNMKSVLYKECIEFIKSKTSEATNLLSLEHHKLVSQFIDHKQRARSRIDDLQRYKTFTKLNEAQRYPVFEAQFQRDKKNRLRLYDSLVPYVLRHEQPDRVDIELENGELLATNNNLIQRLRQTQEELSIINFRIMQEEDDVDTKTIMQNYVVAKTRLEKLEKDYDLLDKKQQRESNTSKKNIAELEAKLRRMEETIIQPLREENKALQDELDNYRALYQ